MFPELESLVSDALAFRSAYMFTPPVHAGERRSYERRHSHGALNWSEGGHRFSAVFTVRCSCNHVYTNSFYYRDGRKTNLTAIKNSLARINGGAAYERF